MDLLIKGLTIHAQTETFHDASIGISNGKIVSINSNESAEKVLTFSHSHQMLPGMIDMHIHGAKGADTMDGTPEALATICNSLPAEGTTAFLASTMSEPKNNIDRALTNVVDFIKHDYPGAEILGIHLEGPFIAKKRAGAQNPENIIPPNLELFKHWQQLSNNLIKQVTIAPEEPDALPFIKYLVSQHIIASFGHSDADYDQTMAGIAAGCTHATHFFNAMRGINHREPGAVTAILNSDKVTVELILDNNHLHPAVVNLTYKVKTKNKIVLITDAMRAKCCGEGEYNLGGQNVIVKNNAARLSDGTLAGSILTMNMAVKNMLDNTNCTIRDIIAMTAENPAKLLNIYDRKGSIAKDKDADLIIMNENHDLIMTLCRGKITYQA